MKKGKLKLSDIEVDSFVTTTKKEAKTVEGGVNIEDYISLVPKLGTACIIYATAGIAGETAGITGTIVRSHQQTDCAGATRLIMGCTNAGTFPCDLGCI